MFDIFTGTRHSAATRRLRPLAVSFAAHAFLTAAVVVPALYVMDQLPEVPTVMAFVAPAPSPPPPPPPPPAAAQASETRQVRSASPNAAPIEAPSRIEPESGMERVEAGVAGGVEGGMPGGIVGGIVGGISDAPPPPPPPLPAPLPAPRRIVRVGGDISPPTLLLRVAPIYPALAEQAHIQGVVIIEATVDENGRVRETKLLRSVKFLDEAAITAVKQWQYSPLLLNGEAMPFVLTVTVSFRVDTTSVAR